MSCFFYPSLIVCIWGNKSQPLRNSLHKLNIKKILWYSIKCWSGFSYEWKLYLLRISTIIICYPKRYCVCTIIKKDGGFGGHLMGGGEFGASARGATKDLLNIFVVVIYLFSLSMWKVKVLLWAHIESFLE